MKGADSAYPGMSDILVMEVASQLKGALFHGDVQATEELDWPPAVRRLLVVKTRRNAFEHRGSMLHFQKQMAVECDASRFCCF